MTKTVAREISGVWYNQLGSQLHLQGDEHGRLTGNFHSTVGSPSGDHPVTGFFDPEPEARGGPLGFTVCWPDAHSVTVWSGRYEVDGDIIVATWLLTGHLVGGDDWCSTVIGHDVFRRNPPTGDVQSV